LGVENWDSIICSEMARLECLNPGWWHPENSCPDPPGTHEEPPLSGGCNYPSCDCVEFYQ